MRASLACIMLLLPSISLAENDSFPPRGDERIMHLQITDERLQDIHLVPGHPLTLSLPAGESIQTVDLGDKDAWHVTVGSSRNSVVIFADRAAAATELKIQTPVRKYAFLLSAAFGSPAPDVILLSNSASAIEASPHATVQSSHPAGSYRLSGAKSLMPKSMHDDGDKTFIEWSDDQAIPAIFSVDRLGHEELINGYMRESAFTLDRTYDKLVFRIDKAEASARRIVQRNRK